MSVLAFCEVLEIWQSPFCSPDLLAVRLCFLFFFFLSHMPSLFIQGRQFSVLYRDFCYVFIRDRQE